MSRADSGCGARKEGTLGMKVRKNMVVSLVAVLLAMMPAAPSTAGDSEKGVAKEQMKFGLNAAKRGYWLEALSRFESANDLVPGRANVLNNIAVALEAAGRFEEALVTYETAMEIAPNDSVLRRNFSQFKEFYEEYLAPPGPKEEASGAEEGQTEAVGEQPGDDRDDS